MEQFSSFSKLQRVHKTAWLFFGFIGLAVLILTGGCTPDTGEGTDMNTSGRDILRVAGEIESANSAFFGPPSVPNIGQYTISFMASEGRVVKAGTPVLKFNPQELEAQLRDKSNTLNEKQKQLEKQENNSYLG